MVVHQLGNNSGESDYSIYNNAGVLQSSGVAFSDTGTEASPLVVALSNGDYLIEDNNFSTFGSPIAGKIYTSTGTFVGSVTLPAEFGGQVIALNGASDPSFVALVQDPAYLAAIGGTTSFSNVSDNLDIESYTSGGTGQDRPRSTPARPTVRGTRHLLISRPIRRRPIRWLPGSMAA